jgi:hypothetical protein
MSPTQPNSSVMPLPSDMTAQKVIEMFVELMLPVCDDGARIQGQIDKQRSRRQKDLNSTNGDTRIEAQRWHEHAVWLTQRRDRLLELLYAQFKEVAELGREMGSSSKAAMVLTPEMYQKLGNIARGSCKLDDALTRRFIERYTREIGWSDGGTPPPPQAAVIEAFLATAKPGSIFLKWSRPQSRCEKVLIYRTDKAAASAGKSRKDDEPIGETTGDFYEDHAAQPGRWYTYRVRAVYGPARGVESVFHVAYPGEVEDVRTALVDGKITLTWKKPTAGTTVWVFRRENAKPEFRLQGGDPTAVSPTIGRCCDPPDRFEDQDLHEGVVYHYLIVSDFGQGVVTKGVLRQVPVPKPPPVVPQVKATYVHSGGKDAIEVVWEPVPTTSPVSYMLVRQEGSVAPDRPNGPNVRPIRESTQSTKVIDEETIIPGTRYTYAVFTRAGDILSRLGTGSNPVDVCAEVANVVVAVGSQAVGLRWRPPANVDQVVVRRRLNEYPKDITDGSPVVVIGKATATDTGLRNGYHYYYRIFSIYKLEAGVEVSSRGFGVPNVIPEEKPQMPANFTAIAEGSQVICTWDPPSFGHVVIRRLNAPHGHRPGTRFNAAELDKMGELVLVESPKPARAGGPVAARSSRAVDNNPTITSPYYGIFAVAGSNAIAGEVKPCVVVPDVTNLRVIRTMKGFVLTWSWPQGCDMVDIVRRVAGWPRKPDDPDAFGSSVTCTRKAYDDAGARFSDSLCPRGVPAIHYTVYARASVGSQFFHAPGTAHSCRRRVPVGLWTVLQYEISSPERRPYKGTHIHLSWTLDNPMPDFRGFVLMADKDQVPASISEGLQLFPSPEDPPPVSSGGAWVSLEQVQREQWGHLFCKVFVADPLQEDGALIIHPNTCTRLTDTGRVDAISVEPCERRYRAGLPRTIICPFDFKEFPVEHLIYGNPEKSDRIKATYTRAEKIWGRLCGRRRPKIVKKDGVAYRQKFCPAGHLLPVTADRQESLTVGLIGAKYSGKTHYVGALVNRLFGRTAEDLGIGPWGLTDDTNRRYEREFKAPLFDDHKELPMTIGTPAPLIYEVRLDLPGRDQFRSVNLALYETAGESLWDPEKARETVQYLSVAAGVILLVDPLQIDSVRERLPASFTRPRKDPEATPTSIINNIRGILEEHQMSTVLSVPVAVVLAKCDVLRDAGLIEPNRLWCMEDKRHIGYFHSDWHEDMSGMMGEYLRRWDINAYATVVSQFPRHAFFGVSSTGCASQGGRYEFVSPWRVEDPLVWLLTELGVLPTKQEHE